MNGFKLGGSVIEPANHSVLTGGKTTRLRPICWDVLMCLVDRRGEIIATDALLQAGWTGRAADPAYVRKAIHEIRAALEDHDGQVIKTVPKVGYLIDAVAIDDTGSAEAEAEADEAETSSLRAPSAGPAEIYERLSSGDYKSISRRLRRPRKGATS